MTVSEDGAVRIEILPDAGAAARRAAAFIAGEASRAVRERGRFLLSLSGGDTPLPMFDALSAQPLPWANVELFQTDERVAPRDSAARNLTALSDRLLSRVALSPGRLHPMPVDDAARFSADPADPVRRDVALAAAAASHSETLAAIAGTPPVLDLVHLGLGSDGHTASLFPGDPALRVDDAWVAATGRRNGHHRMTLTLPTLAAARCLLWLVCGADKAAVLARLLRGDPDIPAGRVRRDSSVIVADEAAAGRLR
jgi:6-phosphogluconolactonase